MAGLSSALRRRSSDALVQLGKPLGRAGVARFADSINKTPGAKSAARSGKPTLHAGPPLTYHPVPVQKKTGQARASIP